MAYYTGTVTGESFDGVRGDIKLFDVIRGIVVANGWTVLETVTTGNTVRHNWWRAPGISGTEQIFLGMYTNYNVPSDYYNYSIYGATGYVNGNSFSTQPGAAGKSVCLWNEAITYWITCNGARLICVMKIQNVYTSFYMGKMLPYCTPSQWPYPVVIGGCMPLDAGYRYDNVNQNSWFTGSNLIMRFVDGTWKAPATWPFNSGMITTYASSLRNTNNDSETAGGDYGLYALVLTDASPNIYGELDGVTFITGFNNAVENTIVISGVTYLIVRNIAAVTLNSYIALRLT